SSRGRHASFSRDWSSDVCSSDLDSPEGMDVFWHSAAHIMAHAVKQLYPEAQFAFGPPVEEGFYYDIDVKSSFTPEDLQRIEEKKIGRASCRDRLLNCGHGG